jgi:lipoyl-dependent peroxiredoxin
VEEAMAIRSAEAEWKGSVTEGGGTVRLGSGAFEGTYSFQSRMEDGAGTNPEELIAAAHAGCFSMALSAVLSRAGTPPIRIHTQAKVQLIKKEEGFVIPRIDLVTQGEVAGVDDATFRRAAEEAKATCPVSKALAGTEIHLDATLVSG